MKVLTIIGTRPEIIRTSRIVPLLDKHCNHVIVHTSQNYTLNLKDLFYRELGLRQPDYVLQSVQDGQTGLSHTNYGLANQLSVMFPQIEKILQQEQPDKVFILGDTNSALCAIIAERMGIPVYHMEAANRSFNREIPEEVNRVLLDSICSYNLFYTPTNRHTLLREGHDPKRIFQCGNPTNEVLEYYRKQIDNSDIFRELNWAKEYGEELQNYFLADIHRAENINNDERLISILEG